MDYAAWPGLNPDKYRMGHLYLLAHRQRINLAACFFISRALEAERVNFLIRNLLKNSGLFTMFVGVNI
jgi:hypothetical protein